MATASQTAFCPKCGAELQATKTDKCQVCNTPLAPPNNEYFGSPDYLWHQREMHLDNCDTSRPTALTKEHNLKKIEEMELALSSWARVCPIDDKIAALRDAHLILSNVVHAPVGVDDIRKLTTIGKAIGKLAQAVEDYFRSGGQIYDREIGRVQAWPDDNDGGNQATR